MDSRALKKIFFFFNGMDRGQLWLFIHRQFGAVATADSGASAHLISRSVCRNTVLLSEYVYKHFHAIPIGEGGRGSHLRWGNRLVETGSVLGMGTRVLRVPGPLLPPT